MAFKGNKQKILGRSALDYRTAHNKFTVYLEKAANDVLNDVAHIEFFQRGATTRAILKAAQPANSVAVVAPCADKDEGVQWLTDLVAGLKLGADIGYLEMVPKGHATEITVRQRSH